MDVNCPKCHSVMTKAKLDNHPIRVYKADVQPSAETISGVKSCNVCPDCGYIELYATNPEKIKGKIH
ncbi:ssDNA-binding Zn-finger/Zn-ribbon topoisomerase 1 [Salirhabdus euzebyi]|uniref:SsDNA-binding Zn-finger/Zn-ribbon topoisomerase 1 n=1 Tax=Salirhabdus euzebyi TaxID=394506 RepID=A0A841Q246_9BACI|nr:hypothetical protein [Salirhabdus euzebyi]MBB6452653.1 ssDNA-binding Zn-finger/Zn-ribbon topoisomerase 1 [Salirhabdus euzebyi]